MIFRFESSDLLWFLLAIPLLALLKGKRGASAAVQFPATELAKQISSFVRSRPGRLLPYLRLLALSCLILALARPQVGSGISEIESSGIDIVLAVDLSTSMWAHDFKIKGKRTDRLTVVKAVVKDYIVKRPNDRIGLVAFAGISSLVSPLTLNHEWLLQNLERLRIGILEDGTAIGTAIGTSVNRLRIQKAKSRILIVLTDGANNAGKISPLAAAEAANAYNIKIYTIGAGQEGVVPVPRVLDPNGNPLFDRNGKLLLKNIQSDIDLDSLKEIARLTRARFFHATDTTSLEEIYHEIDRLEKSEIKLKHRTNFTDIFMWPAIAGLSLLVLEQLMSNTFYRRIP